MSRTYKDKKLELKYPEWNNKHDCVVYARVSTYTAYYIQTKTTKRKKKRSAITKHYDMYSKSPSWWTRLYMNRPKRRHCRAWERKVLFEDVEETDCPDFKNKPYRYYW